MQHQRRHSVSIITSCCLLAIAVAAFIRVGQVTQKGFYDTEGVDRPTVEFRVVEDHGRGDKRPYEWAVNWDLRFYCGEGDNVWAQVPNDFSRSGVYRHEWPRVCDFVAHARVRVSALVNPSRCAPVNLERDVVRPTAGSPTVVWLTSVCMPERTASRAAPP